jgi:ABC-type uncharacterized transport system substrate-binding protein
MFSRSRSSKYAALGCCFICLASRPSSSQPEGKTWRIGLCHVGLDHEPPSLPSLKDELAQLGYLEKRNLIFDWRNQATEETALATVREWARANYDLIVAFEDQCVRAAKTTTTTIPVVFVHASDPVLNDAPRGHSGGRKPQGTSGRRSAVFLLP